MDMFSSSNNWKFEITEFQLAGPNGILKHGISTHSDGR